MTKALWAIQILLGGLFLFSGGFKLVTPIEEMVSKVKGAMRSAGARTTNAVYWAFASALDQVTLNDIAGWFRSRAAYAMRL